MLIAKATPGSIGDHVWDAPGAVIDVPDDLGQHIITVAPDEYTLADDAPKAKPATRRGGKPADES